MPLSSAVVAGNPALASQFNNVRLDAIALTEDGVAGEAYTATTTVGGVTLPTLLYQSAGDGRWYKASSATATPGWAQICALAYNAAAGAASAVKLYLPGSLVTGSGMTVGVNYFTSATAGGLEAFSATTTLYYKLMGTAMSTTSFYFYPTSNTTLTYENNQMYLTCGEALARYDLCYIKQADGLAYKADGDVLESGNAIAYCVCNFATSGSGQTSRFYVPGSRPNINGTYAAGNIVYPASTAGQVGTTRMRGSRMIGIALSSSSVYLFPGDPNIPELVFNCQAGENWTKGDLLYFKKSDSRYYRADADAAESGICEFPAVALATHTGGAGSEQVAYMPNSEIPFGTVTLTSGGRLYPSATTGAYQVDTPASYDTYYRVIGYANRTDTFAFQPQDMQFLAAGVQEKGYCATGSYVQTGQACQESAGVNFKKIMSNTPSSITFTATASQYAAAPTANNITRFGFRMYVIESANPNNQQTWWAGTYQTVGN